MPYTHSPYNEVLMMLGGALLAAPIFKRLGLGTILGYLAAGVVIGPILHQIRDGEELLGVAELGVVFLLFLIGLELKPSRLWSMRHDIFGLGIAQVTVTGLVLTGLTLLFGLADWDGALIIGFGLALSSTAFAMQILDEQGDTNTRYGQRAFSLLLLQDLAIVPLLALIPLLAQQMPEDTTTAFEDFLIAVSAIAALLVAGRYLLNPLFQVIARTGAREAMIAAALFVVLAAAMLLQMAGLSMAMGAFLAGVLLADSSYRHELQADVEPFRGILLGLFFMAVGLSLHLDVIFSSWLTILVATPAVMLVKSLIIYALCRFTGSPHNDAVRIALVLPQGGEFGFVLFTAASAAGIFSGDLASLLIAIVTISMALTPIAAALSRFLLVEDETEEMEEDFEGAGADVLMIGFSRFGQIAAQILLAGGREVTVIDHSTDRVRQAASFGFRIYFGDGTRKDVLRAAGIERSQIVAICTNVPEVTDKIVELIQSEFPFVQLYVRSFDRRHTLRLLNKGVNYQIRETLESAFAFGGAALAGLGVDDERIATIESNLRARDADRLATQQAGGMLTAGRDLVVPPTVQPEPLTVPKREAKSLNKEAASATSDREN